MSQVSPDLVDPSIIKVYPAPRSIAFQNLQDAISSNPSLLDPCILAAQPLRNQIVSQKPQQNFTPTLTTSQPIQKLQQLHQQRQLQQIQPQSQVFIAQINPIQSQPVQPQVQQGSNHIQFLMQYSQQQQQQQLIQQQLLLQQQQLQQQLQLLQNDQNSYSQSKHSVFTVNGLEQEIKATQKTRESIQQTIPRRNPKPLDIVDPTTNKVLPPFTNKS
eukprot:NODE_6586_length_868_cov_22.704698_g5990_i0.p1 GENE.NODE_6586_length_868_cov_22.704698_g5990_i0~~NODE_6586_length_868_cov_22.704698_g5990_i0.p1  ORF type:complete len:216 (-),score=42.72 NODE_6586_length_868_cov_22.704698_g5990_i0:160-807(-)